jgi:peptidoglycan/xylan/chitin deacetylase (PgdA/CDA1 family)
MAYAVKTPRWLRNIIYSRLTWKMPAEEKPAVYLTFDDGPHPEATPYALQQLAQYGAKASFFCIGKNVALHPEIYSSILQAGHTTGNHTNDHMNGWHNSTEDYIGNIRTAATLINSKSFRPPYGRVKRAQADMLLQNGWSIYMWDVLSGDFDTAITPEKCLDNVLRNIEPGSIVVFHDSEKAWPRMNFVLPKVLEYCKEQGWELKSLPKK